MAKKRVGDDRMLNDSQQGTFRHRLIAELRKIASFGAIGALNGGVNYVVTLAVVALVFVPAGLGASDVALAIAKTIGWLVAVTNSYVMNSLITFAAQSGRQLAWKSYLRFAGFGVFGLAAEVTSFIVAARYLPLAIAAVVPIAASFLVNFTLTRFFVFPDKKNGNPNSTH